MGLIRLASLVLFAALPLGNPNVAHRNWVRGRRIGRRRRDVCGATGADHRLKKQFGPEYGRVIADTGDRHRTEAALEERHRRVRKLSLRPLSATEKANFQEGWRSVQARFVDDPAIALTEADALIGKVMATEGYPVTEFEQRAEDISVDHPIVVENYRDGHELALRNQQGRASTEDMRKAMINYRRLFEELVGLPEGEPAERMRL